MENDVHGEVEEIKLMFHVCNLGAILDFECQISDFRANFFCEKNKKQIKIEKDAIEIKRIVPRIYLL